MMENVVYQEMSPEERMLDWRITRQVMADAVLMNTLHASQAEGEKHAVIALVENGELKETYVSPEQAVKKNFPFNPVTQAFDYYDVQNGVCLLIVRDGKAVVSLNSIR
ncbi:MAG: hypothetical protein ABSG21_12620 [Spirochaetia bacterium]